MFVFKSAMIDSSCYRYQNGSDVYISNYENIKICYDPIVDSGDLKIGKKDYNYNTLEPKLIKANSENLALFNKLFGTKHKDVDSLRKYMKHNKTECAIKIFETNEEIVFPDYILEAIKDE